MLSIDESLLPEIDDLEFTISPSSVLKEAIEECNKKESGIILERDNYGVQQAQLWANLGYRFVDQYD